MSDTPRTDAENDGRGYTVSTNFSRQLERELAASEARYSQSNLGRWQERAIKAEDALAAMTRERDALRVIVDAGTQLRHGIGAHLEWDRAVAALKEEK